MFRSEKTVPKISFASSSVVRVDGPETDARPLATVGVSEVGREDLPTVEVGRGSQRLLYMHSAGKKIVLAAAIKFGDVWLLP